MKNKIIYFSDNIIGNINDKWTQSSFFSRLNLIPHNNFEDYLDAYNNIQILLKTNVHNKKSQRILIGKILSMLNVSNPNTFKIENTFKDSSIVFHVVTENKKHIMIKVYDYNRIIVNNIKAAQESYWLKNLEGNPVIKTPEFYGSFTSENLNNENVYINVAEWLDIKSTLDEILLSQRSVINNKNIASLKEVGSAMGNLHQESFQEGMSYNHEWLFGLTENKLENLAQNGYLSVDKYIEIQEELLEKRTSPELVMPDKLVFAHGDGNPANWAFLNDGRVSSFDFEYSGMAPPERDLARLETTIMIDMLFAGKKQDVIRDTIDVINSAYYKQIDFKINKEFFLLCKVAVSFSCASSWIGKNEDRIDAWINLGLSFLNLSKE